MADADYDDFYDYAGYDAQQGHAPMGGRWQRLVNVAGALTSLALIAGIGVWAYRLAVRDVNGVPVIQALEGPARIAPENPGGELALHQGMAVNRIAAEGTAAEPADRLTLAPGAANLSTEDTAMGGLAKTGAESVEAPQSPANPQVVGEAITPAAMRPIEPLPEGPVEMINLEDGEIAAQPYVAADVISTDIPGVSASLKPLARPSGAAAATSGDGDGDGVDAMAEAAAAAVAMALAPDAAIDVDPGTLSAGTRVVQIGSYANEADARLDWETTVARFGPLMLGKRRVIEPSESGGETFYRLRVEGFTDAVDARAFCAALKVENAVCVPAVVK
ncbi:MAG: SPOR domain-containing protein [Proteobacteria bacterium]|nr:SPOR domain-containing protein [Pseudomonadota bacterium]